MPRHIHIHMKWLSAAEHDGDTGTIQILIRLHIQTEVEGELNSSELSWSLCHRRCTWNTIKYVRDYVESKVMWSRMFRLGACRPFVCSRLMHILDFLPLLNEQVRRHATDNSPRHYATHGIQRSSGATICNQDIAGAFADIFSIMKSKNQHKAKFAPTGVRCILPERHIPKAVSYTNINVWRDNKNAPLEKRAPRRTTYAFISIRSYVYYLLDYRRVPAILFVGALIWYLSCTHSFWCTCKPPQKDK